MHMPKNVEIKARATNFEKQRAIAEALSDTPLEVLSQKDTFFNTDKGRLKLRIFENNVGQLILYSRQNQAGPKVSDYQISDSADPHSLKQILSAACGVIRQVNKTRYLYLVGRTRIHFDKVEKLGEFIELEVVLNDDEDMSDGELEAKSLMTQLSIKPSDLIEVAYADLLAQQEG